MAVSRLENKKFKRFIAYYGSSVFDKGGKSIKEDTFFDLASLTKPLVCVPAILSLMEGGLLDWQSDLKNIFKKKDLRELKNITISQLMNHSSGLPPHRKYFRELLLLPIEKRKKQLIELILNEKLICKPGSEHHYSDLGYMLLGEIVESLSDYPLDIYVKEKIFRPIELQKSLIFPKREDILNMKYAVTGECPWSGQILKGKAHDDNCRALGGVAGHAGVFGTLGGVLSFLEQLLLQVKGSSRHPNYSNERIIRATKRSGEADWSPGFAMVSQANSSSGKYFSRKSFGHLGFTGTSFWVDPQQDIIIILLTNRVISKKGIEHIRTFRPIFHDVVMESIRE